eukprot:CAMPEP_0202891522 /NCGR_PEP_ID=MMETSP1392-20130828/1564_1 /ASSEMBLY_ACC=CAM_ASM_000868 /TAXON_ID=225041 /ORGANISM="Chlamydomonas chlamydogama, Strain SAG 11-48b" /LENGTH=393 /DNA_ID=CAMNT_0049575303 /DNA_START=71 /DNA_END=1252 /DNA_ORIENTATION=-
MDEKEKIFLEAEQVLNKSRGLSQRCSTYINRLVGEFDSIAVEINSLQQGIKTAEASAKKLQANDALYMLKEARNVIQGLGPGGDLRKFCRPKVPLMLRLLLGDKVNVVAFRVDQSIAIKEEYHAFRDRSAWYMLLGPMLLILAMRYTDVLRVWGHGVDMPHTFSPLIMTGFQLYLLWLTYFYLALALRENVLLINGSRIKKEWLQHHYWSAACALLMIGLPVYSPAVFIWCQNFLLWSCVQSIVMMFQNRYQKGRMYTRIALGKSSVMDVVSGESSGGMGGHLLLLYPMLFGLQVWQLAIGLGVAYRFYPSFLSNEGWLDAEAQGSDLRGMRGVCLVGIMFSYMAITNFKATVMTFLEKQRSARLKAASPMGARSASSGRMTRPDSKFNYKTS